MSNVPTAGRAATPAAAPVRPILVFLAASLALRLAAIFATGYCDDEAYVVTVSRVLSLSYFDHPPLHQWIVHAWASAFGEGRATRLPFLGFTLIAQGALALLARRLFSPAAGVWTAFVFGANAYFLVYPDGYVMPDPPLFALLALSALAAGEILFGARPPGLGLWLALGLTLGLAGLTKYSAIFFPLGLLGFLAGSRRARVWFADPRPYLAALLALACLAPALIWNAEHGWVSLAFQSGRTAGGLTFDGRAIAGAAEALGAQVAAMTPWILLPLVAGLALGFRRGPDSPARFLLWLALPALIVFALTPFLGKRPIAHWFNSGWLFAFPLAGAWLAERQARFQRRFFALAAALAGVVFAAFLAAVLLGPIGIKGLRDPTAAMFDFPAAPLRAAYARSGAGFALVDNWRLGGRIGVALGPEAPVCALGGDPRGFAFACDARKMVGRNALVAHEKKRGEDIDVTPFFSAVAPLGDLPVGRRGAAERVLRLETGRDLTRPPPLPYGP